MCELKSIINLINNLTLISLPADSEGDLIKYITGKSWEKVLKPGEFAPEDYYIARIQPPLTHYHTPH